ncbi:MAG: Sua5/YciO/YrdC/YwlC family protein [Cyanobium sp.]
MSGARLRLRCRGVVQGVGFRPAVHRLARQLGLAGTLHNASGLVQLDLHGDRQDLERFLRDLPAALPPGARLEPLEPQWLPAAAGAADPSVPAASELRSAAEPALRISAAEPDRSSPLTIGLIAPSLVADRAPCAACLRDLEDPESRRHGDPFISCCACGPRYAIATATPWRRAHTTQAPFRPCPACAAEFADPNDRRFHAETISCPHCGPRLSLLVAVEAAGGPSSEEGGDDGGPPPGAGGVTGLGPAAAGAFRELLGPPPQPGCSASAHHAALIAAAADLLNEGRILALQGVGGFQLLVDASHGPAVARLRRRKRRPAKPFALLVADPAWIAAELQSRPDHASPEASPDASSPEASSPEASSPEASSPEASNPEASNPEASNPEASSPEASSPEASSPDATGPEHPSAERPPVDQQPVDWAALSPAALRELRSAAAPIVLLPRRAGRPDPYPAVAPGSPLLGVMLPASPLHWLLARRFGRPLVCTSGNRSGEPLCTDPTEALQRLAGIADAVLFHDRPIARPLDDSLLQLIDGRPSLLRRARGYAPEPLAPPPRLDSGPPPAAAPAAAPGSAPAATAGSPAAAPGSAPAATAGSPAAASATTAAAPAAAPRSAAAATAGSPASARATTPAGPPAGDHPGADFAGGLVLAVGGDLKCAPALASGERVWLAPHLGDLADPRIQARLTAGLAELQARQARPLQAIACDRHPAYRSHQLAAAHAATTGTPLLTVQHHAAHALAVIAEHGLQTPLLAFCADGLGYGEAIGDDPDRQPQPPLWGGELLGIGAQRIERLAALRPLPLVGGERACLEPRRVALGLLASAGPWALAHRGAACCLAAFPATDRALLLQLLEQGLHCPWTSSLGRLFDGVASLLGVCQRLSYEGEAALRLQGLASRQGAWAEADHCGAAHPFSRSAAPAVGLETLPLGWIDWEPALAALLAERAAGVPRRISAARFHRGLADALGELLTSAAATRGCRVVVLAGGCFQNALLLEALIRRLRRSGLEPHWAAAVPPNDGGLALGQLEALRRASRRAF